MNLKKLTINILTKLLSPFFGFLSFLVPKGNVILLGTYSRHKYGENTKYLYEYLSEKKELDVYWITDNSSIINKLRKENLKFISFKSPLKMLWILLRTKVVIDSGTGFFNPFKILDSEKVIKITTSHGNGPKVTVSRFHPPDNHRIGLQQIEDLYRFDFINYPSSYSAKYIGKRIHLLPNHKIISLGYPRCDQYNDSEIVTNAYKEKKIAKTFCSNVSDVSKIILYTPTWRPYDYNFPLEKMPLLDMIEFNKWLVESDSFFFFSVHTAHLPNKIPSNLERIIYIDPNKYPFYDTNSFMLEVDILINDYSTTSTDIAILKTPQIFFMPDYDQYEEESGFVEDYRKIMPGEEIFNYKDLIKNINHIYTNKLDYLKNHEDNRQNLLSKYYDFYNKNSSEEFYRFIKSKIEY